MKKFIGLLLTSCLLLVSSVCLAQEPDSTLSVHNVFDQVTQVIQSVTGKDLVYQIVFVAAVIGVFVHAWQWTQIGIKNNPATPAQMVWSYWFRENVPVKLASILTAVYPTQLFAKMLEKLAPGWVTYIAMAILGLALGYCLDFVYSRYKKLFPNLKTA